MARFQLTQIKVSWTALLVLAHFLYLLVGAIIFQLLEREAESNNRNHFQLEKLHFLTNYSCLDGPALEKFVQVILDAWEKGVNPSGNSTNPSNWDFSSSFFFAGTVVTTIGYGNLSPSTVSGQVFCVFYALCGIPLNLVFLNQLGKCLTIHLGRLSVVQQKVLTWLSYDSTTLTMLLTSNAMYCTSLANIVITKQSVEVLAVAMFLMMGSLLFLVIPPLVFSYVEGWTYGESFYYAFITLSTIGFGDYVVGTDPDKHYISVYRSLAGVWIIFALAWLALILNMAAQIMEHAIGLTHPSFNTQEEVVPPSKQDEGLDQRAIQPKV